MKGTSRESTAEIQGSDNLPRFSFDLVTEPWIPVVPIDARAPLLDVSLRDALVRSHEWREITDPSPLVTFALHRLLLAVLHRVVGDGGTPGPMSTDDWGELWQRGQFPSDQIQGYLSHGQKVGWFDLFHPERPFYQSNQPPLDHARGIHKLALEISTDDLLFEHRKGPNLHHFTPAEAARQLVAFQSFALGGKTHGESADGALLTKAALPLVRGDSLFQTLCLNMVLYDPLDDSPFRFDPEQDRPAWELPPPTYKEERQVLGYLDLLTWQSRAVRLQPALSSEGQVIVPKVVIFPGRELPGSRTSIIGKDPALWVLDTKPGNDGTTKLIYFSFQEERALWRDSHVLLQHFYSARGRGHAHLFAYLDLYVREFIPQAKTLRLDMLGMNTDSKKVNFWRHERLPVPAAYLDDPDLVRTLGTMLGKAEEVSRLFRWGQIPAPWNPEDKTDSPTQMLVLLLLAQKRPDRKELKRLTDSAKQLIQELALEQRYWGQLAPNFHHLITTLPTDEAAAEEQWLRAIDRVARNVFENAWLSMDRSARTTQAFARAGNIFYSALNSALNANVGSAGSPSAATA